ncbi:Glycosyltransferase [Dissulfuribacter thermophilus]|uniref:Glycosyltransferase n=2 Tax=Dissulfuribacter thermophilus TaxID=1156395 RepID=A0A1B9F409_9BACT|nr:Glycosyltransferase [Dissulfuribacter thermophilus]
MALPLLNNKIDINIAIEMPKGVELIELPGFIGVVDFIKKLPLILPKLLFILDREIKRSDAVMVMHDDFLGFIAIMKARKYKKIHLLYIGGNQVEVVRNKYNGFKRWAAVCLARFFESLDQYFMDRGLIVLATGNEDIIRLSAPGRHIYPYFTSLISNKDIIYKKPQGGMLDEAKIIYVGFLTENKGVHILLQAIAEICQEKYPFDIKLNIIGDGYYRTKLETICRQLGIGENVKFHGFIGNRNRLKQLFIASDLCVLPSMSEGIPKVLLEAMAYGVPILTTNVGGIPDIIENEVNGLMVPANSVNELKNGITRILSDHKLRHSLIEGGYRFIQKHTREKQAKAIVNYLIGKVNND